MYGNWYRLAMRRWQIPPSRFRPKDWKGHVWLFFRDVGWGTVLAVFYVATILYKVFGCRWIEPWLNRWASKRYASDIREAMPFLFEVYGGSVVPSPRKELEPSAEDVAYVKAGSLVFRFSRWRDETLEVLVADSSQPRDMYSLDDLLGVLVPNDVDAPLNGERSLRRYGQLLKARFQTLSTALSEDHIEETRKMLSERRLCRR